MRGGLIRSVTNLTNYWLPLSQSTCQNFANIIILASVAPHLTLKVLAGLAPNGLENRARTNKHFGTQADSFLSIKHTTCILYK